MSATLTLREAAERLKLSERTLRLQAKAGLLKAKQISRRTILVREDWLAAWLEGKQAR